MSFLNMDKAHFCIAIHFHQPIGNFDNILERTYRLCYQPFFELLFNYPDIKMTFHISGCLLDYLDTKYPEAINIVKEMVSRGQIEMLGGGYYEPILPAIPRRDIIGQIQMMSEYLKERFDTIPSGMWIAERVWEPGLEEPIYDAGINYSILDDTIFLKAGIRKEQLYGYFLIGKGKKKIAIFPSDKMLRYMIPFKYPDEIKNYFRNISKDKKNLLFIYGDDGEKFGEWPGTHEWVYKKRWLEDFLALLKQNSDWLKLVRFSDYIKENPPIDTIELPSGSYEEMLEWSDGHWMNFLKKYPETNQMHKKMFYVSDKIATIEKKKIKDRPDKLKEAKKELYKGQCNCAYWHGVFGGIYLFHLRNAIYKHLINADKIVDDIIHAKKQDWQDIKYIDFELDGKKKIIMEHKSFALYFDPHDGGVLKEFDNRALSFNLINTLSRKEENYHKKILDAVENKEIDKIQTIHDDFRTAQPIFRKKLIYDKFPRYCLRNYFLSEDLEMERFANSSFEGLGDFARGSFKFKKKKRGFLLERSGKVSDIKIDMSKQIQIISEKEIEILYIIQKYGKEPLEKVILGIEFNVTLPYLNASRYHYFCDDKNMSGLNTRGSVFNVSSFGIKDFDKEFNFYFKFFKNLPEIWYFPVETISQSERTYELNYQCSCIFLRWKPDFNKKNKYDLKFNWIFKEGG